MSRRPAACGVLVLVAALSGCTRLSRVEAVQVPGARYLDSASGVRFRPREWLSLDVLAGSRTDLERIETQFLGQLGIGIGGGKTMLRGRADFTRDGEVAGFLGLEVEW